jgi:hypothetical protein
MNVSSLIVRGTQSRPTVIVLLVIASILLWWVLHGRRSLVHTFEPDYLVTGVNSSARTIVLQKADHRYIVRCEEYCAWFSLGKSYEMHNVVNGLEFKAWDRTIILPIVQEDVTFPTEGGRG